MTNARKITMIRPTLVATTIALLLATSAPGEDGAKDKVTIVKLDSATGSHVTTRTAIRRVWKQSDVWFAIYATGGPQTKAVYRTSRDGLNWSERKERPDRGLTYFVDGKGYAYCNKRGPVSDNASIPTHRHWISTAELKGESIQWGEGVEFFKESPEDTYFYYVQPRVDSTGRICMTMRHADRSSGADEQHPPQSIVWFRSKRPGDLSEWEGPVEVIAGRTPRERADLHQCVPLEDGKSIVIGRTSASHYDEDGPKGSFYARLFDGKEWEKQYKLDTSDGTGGSDRRMSATFDEQAKLLHLVYTDGEKRLVYRTCRAPYRLSDWSEPEYPINGKCFTQCVGLDRSTNPARPVVAYGVQRRSDGGRLHAGELYLIRGDGAQWTEPLLVSEKGRDDNWYPNLIEDCSGEIGILYLRNFYGGRRPEGDEAPWDVMFARVERTRNHK